MTCSDSHLRVAFLSGDEFTRGDARIRDCLVGAGAASHGDAVTEYLHIRGGDAAERSTVHV